MKLKTYLKDLDASMKKFTNVAPYHAFRPIAESIEFLGKCLLGSDAVSLETEKITRICFNYAIIKLNSLSKYKNYITQPDLNDRDITHSILRKNNNAPVQEILNKIHQVLDPYYRLNVEIDLYKELRCALTHAQRPGEKLDLVENTHQDFYFNQSTNLFTLDIFVFYNDFHNAINELLQINDQNIQLFLETDYLRI